MNRTISKGGATLALVLSFAATSLASNENLLTNGDFESGGNSVASWINVFPPAIAKPSPTFVATTNSPHGGIRAGTIGVEYEGGYTSFTQTIPLDAGMRMLHLESFARIVENATTKGSANILIWFSVPSAKDGGELAQSRRLVSEKEWTLLTVDAAVPKGATEALVRMGVTGPCKASFDDARLTASDKEGAVCKLAVASGDYSIKSKAATSKAFVRVSVPFPLGGQTPLALRVTSEPKDRIAALEFEKDRENRPLKITFAALKPGESVSFTVETLTLLRDRPLATGVGVPLTPKAKIPKDVLPHLKAAAGIDCDDPSIKKLAATFAKADFAALMHDVTLALHDKLKYDGGSSQGAKECLAAGKAVCTGYANVGASLLIAAGVPTRILACVQPGARLQEHYIAEAWTSDLGWSRMESTAATFPWKDSENLVLRIVYPDAARSPADVPLYLQSSTDVVADFRMGKDTCWQGGSLISTIVLDKSASDAVEACARGRLEELTKQSATGASAALVPLGTDSTLPKSASDLLKAVKDWLDGR